MTIEKFKNYFLPIFLVLQIYGLHLIYYNMYIAQNILIKKSDNYDLIALWISDQYLDFIAQNMYIFFIIPIFFLIINIIFNFDNMVIKFIMNTLTAAFQIWSLPMWNVLIKYWYFNPANFTNTIDTFLAFQIKVRLDESWIRSFIDQFINKNLPQMPLKARNIFYNKIELIISAFEDGPLEGQKFLTNFAIKLKEDFMTETTQPIPNTDIKTFLLSFDPQNSLHRWVAYAILGSLGLSFCYVFGWQFQTQFLEFLGFTSSTIEMTKAVENNTKAFLLIKEKIKFTQLAEYKFEEINYDSFNNKTEQELKSALQEIILKKKLNKLLNILE